MIEIRPGRAADAPAIVAVRRESWFAAYEGIVATPLIDRATAPGSRAVNPPPYLRTLVAVAGDDPAVVGYASFGPERSVASPAPTRFAPAAARPRSSASPAPAAPAAHLFTPAGQVGQVGEVYAIYVAPAWWSTGVGRGLMSAVLSALTTEAYRRVVLWVLADNARARRFYDRAGFGADGGTNILTGLGGVLELRYSRDL